MQLPSAACELERTPSLHGRRRRKGAGALVHTWAVSEVAGDGRRWESTPGGGCGEMFTDVPELPMWNMPTSPSCQEAASCVQLALGEVGKGICTSTKSCELCPHHQARAGSLPQLCITAGSRWHPVRGSAGVDVEN